MTEIVEEAGTVAISLMPRQRAERRFYTGMALLMIILVLIGFAPTFYLKPLEMIHYPRPGPALTPALMIHGIAFSLWMLIFLAQTRLVAAGRRDIHRILGTVSIAFAAMLVPIMYLNAVWQVAFRNQPPFTDPLTWTVVPLAAIPFYIAITWLGWRWSRRDLQAHKRLMLGLMIMLMEPAISRYPVAPPTLGGFAALATLGWLVFVPLFLWDRRSMGHLHWATRLGASLYAILIMIQVVFLAMPGPWASAAAHLPGVGS